jgi:hypothetical protein
VRIKDKSRFSEWTFIIVTPTGEDQIIPPTGYSNSKESLLNTVLTIISTYDSVSDGEYSKRLRELAEQSDVSFAVYIGMLIEHQLCLRLGGNRLPCWNDGLGDRIHEMMKPIDSFVANTPEPVKKVLQRAIERITPSKSKTLSGCSACGGSKRMNPNDDNLGRAGKLNRIFK